MHEIQLYSERVSHLNAKLIGGIGGFFDGVGKLPACRHKTISVGLRIRNVPILIAGPKAPLASLVQEGEIDTVAGILDIVLIAEIGVCSGKPTVLIARDEVVVFQGSFELGFVVIDRKAMNDTNRNIAAGTVPVVTLSPGGCDSTP